MKRTEKYLKEKTIIIFTAGTGNPYFTTDTAAALRACQIGADVLLKATKVDGVYDKDPVVFKDARFFRSISYDEVLKNKLQVMDLTAFAMCRDNMIPVAIFNINLGRAQHVSGREEFNSTAIEREQFIERSRHHLSPIESVFVKERRPLGDEDLIVPSQMIAVAVGDEGERFFHLRVEPQV